MKKWPSWEKILFAAFLFWSAAGLIFSLGHFSPGDLPSWPGLREFVAACIRWGDPILILLAFANTHVHAAREWTPGLARRWALIVLVAALVLETVGVKTGLIFGTYRYTDRFGPMIGLVPLTIPLAWQVVVTNALFLARLVLRSRLGEAVLTGFICTAYDFILEPFASHARHYWLWSGGTVPLQNYAAWFVLSGLLVWLFAPRRTTRYPGDLRPGSILAVTLLIFLAGTI
jgi:putative membrane protein